MRSGTAACRRRRSTASWPTAIAANPPPALQRPPVAARLHHAAEIAAADLRAVLRRAPSALPETYRRYLVNGLREKFALPGTPIRLTLRAKANPYAGRANAALS